MLADSGGLWFAIRMSAHTSAPIRINPDPDVGRALRRHRTLAGLTLRETARRAGISAGYLSDLETGRRKPHPDIVARIADGIAGATA